jgi:Na+-driven multidrug efflux pump
MGQQNLILLINIIGFWGCGLIPGYFLTFNMGLGLHGYAPAAAEQ